MAVQRLANPYRCGYSTAQCEFLLSTAMLWCSDSLRFGMQCSFLSQPFAVHSLRSNGTRLFQGDKPLLALTGATHRAYHAPCEIACLAVLGIFVHPGSMPVRSCHHRFQYQEPSLTLACIVQCIAIPYPIIQAHACAVVQTPPWRCCSPIFATAH